MRLIEHTHTEHFLSDKSFSKGTLLATLMRPESVETPSILGPTDVSSLFQSEPFVADSLAIKSSGPLHHICVGEK